MSFFGPDALSLAAWRTLTAPDGNNSSNDNKKRQVIMQRSGGSHFSETNEGIQLSVDIPGVKAKELLVKVDKGILTISGSRKITLEGGGRKKFRFEKNFSIDVDSIDVQSITANLCNGVLILKANKQTPKGPHIVQVTEHDVEEPEEEDEEEEEDDSKKSPEVLTVKEDSDEKGKKK
jgi:HSP20 family molecular chaperone IbpA